jgi:hypothetical protein
VGRHALVVLRNIVDDEFLRNVHFVTDLCEWHGDDGGLPSDDILTVDARVYAAAKAKAATHLDFLVRCFDTWVDADTPQCSPRPSRNR